MRKITSNNLLSTSVALSLVLLFTLSLEAQVILLPNTGQTTGHGSLGDVMDGTGMQIVSLPVR